MNMQQWLQQLKKYTLLLVLLTFIFSLSIVYFAENHRLTSKVTESTLTLSFSVKAPAPGPGPSPAGGGGGGSGVFVEPEEKPPAKEFELTPKALKISVKQGETKKGAMTLKNLGKEPIEVVLKLIGFDAELVTFPTGLQEYSVLLLKGQEVVIPITASAPPLYKIGVYSGIITAHTLKTIEDSALFVEVKPAIALLDSAINILPQYKNVLRGSPFYATFALKNLGPPGRVDVRVIYGLRDVQGREYELKREVLAVETQTEVIRAFLTPYNLALGPYALYAKVAYRDAEDIAADTFEVSEEEVSFFDQTILLAIVLLAFILLILLFYTLFHMYVLYPLVRKKGLRGKVKKGRKGGGNRQWIAAQLRVLEESYKAGVISEAAYRQDKEQLEKRLKR